ncbi:MAG: YfbU family protein [Bacteroidales bacterium]
MKLTNKERLFLMNQYLILDKLYPDYGYSRNISILKNGFSKEYSDLESHIYKEITEENCDFVYDVLEMYRSIYDSNAQFNIPNTRFPGFDGNNPDGCLNYATFLIDEKGLYEEHKNSNGYNSHLSVNTKYRNMLAKWKPIYEERINWGVGHAFLSKEEIKELLNTY